MKVLRESSVDRGGADISRIDPNFRAPGCEGLSIAWRNALEEPFALSGFPWRPSGGRLFRLPETVTGEMVPRDLLYLANHTSGGAIRFRCDSPLLLIRYRLTCGSDMNHMPRSGSCGFDLYEDAGTPGERFAGAVQPSRDEVDGAPGERLFFREEHAEMRDWMLNLPLYSGVEQLEIGVAPGSVILPPRPHRLTKPVLFYGSSITQGGCAGRPGNSYAAMLCRALDAPLVNLGFSGNARGETAIADAIAGLELAAFVYDYDYNAPDADWLCRTHEPFFRRIRIAQPELPILLLSRCSRPEPGRRDVVRRTFEQAVAAGDRQVRFIDGSELFQPAGEAYCTVDGCHPNDLGFYLMFRRTLPVLREMLGLS